MSFTKRVSAPFLPEVLNFDLSASEMPPAQHTCFIKYSASFVSESLRRSGTSGASNEHQRYQYGVGGDSRHNSGMCLTLESCRRN